MENNNKYQRGKIYKIVCGVTDLVYVGSTIQPTLAKRLCSHVCDYKSNLMGKKNFITSYKVLENNNYNIELICNAPCNSKDELHAIEGKYIRELECVNKMIAGRTPKQYREENKEKVKQGKHDYHEKNKAKIAKKSKLYRETNSEILKEKKHINYENNKVEITKKIQIYKEANEELVKKRQHDWYERNKEALSEKNKAYNAAHSDELREKKKVYYQAHKKEFNEKQKARNKDNTKLKEHRNEVCDCECGSTYTRQNKGQHVKSKKHNNFVNS